MQTKMRLSVPDSAEATLALTMTIKEWKEFQDQLSSHWPSGRIHTAISEVVMQAEKLIWGTTE